MFFLVPIAVVYLCCKGIYECLSLNSTSITTSAVKLSKLRNLNKLMRKSHAYLCVGLLLLDDVTSFPPYLL